MDLNVPLPVFIGDLILLLVIGYAAFYALRRVNRYEGSLNRFLMITAGSLLLATLGRALDVLDDVAPSPERFVPAEQLLYFVSIVGVAYGIINYIGNVERRIMPTLVKGSPGRKLRPGGFLYFGEKDLLDFLASTKAPTLVITRSPWKYEGVGDHVQALWITQASDKGIGPTKLHVILDSTVRFFQEGGGLVVVDCLEVLILYNDFQTVFRFLSALRDYAIGSGSTVLVVTSRSVVDERQLNVLSREFTPIKNLRELLKTSS